MQLDNIVYPGSDQYSPEELAAPGTVELDLQGEPLIRVVDTAYILFQVPDLEKQRAFLEDFGMVSGAGGDDALYMRGYGPAPWIYAAYRGEQAAFLGAGFLAASEADLQRIASETGSAIEAVDGEGGGSRVRLRDPDGFIVDIVHGREALAPLDTRRELLPVNFPGRKNRLNRGQRPPLAPSPIERFGHYVLMVSDFEASWAWYRRHLGLLPTDVLCTGSGLPVLAFSRLDKGAEPADHHTVVLSAGPRAGYMHSAYESFDQDTLGQGQQYLKLRGWSHFWGIGRHILGSQIFDYWLDPCGHEVEHYADGDVFDSSHPTHYHLVDRGGLWAWGHDLPAAMKPKVGLRDMLKILLGERKPRQRMMELKKAMDRKPRPWLK